MLNDFIGQIEKNIKGKGYTEAEEKYILDAIKAKYQDSDLFKITIEAEKCASNLSRSQRIEKWRQHYEELEKQGTYVFDPSEQIVEGAIDNRLEYGRTELHKAVCENDLNKIKQLITNRANSNLVDNNGCTPYELALLEQKTAIVDLFESLGIFE